VETVPELPVGLAVAVVAAATLRVALVHLVKEIMAGPHLLMGAGPVADQVVVAVAQMQQELLLPLTMLVRVALANHLVLVDLQ
jgi:hypothetical protein